MFVKRKREKGETWKIVGKLHQKYLNNNIKTI